MKKINDSSNKSEIAGGCFGCLLVIIVILFWWGLGYAIFGTPIK